MQRTCPPHPSPCTRAAIRSARITKLLIIACIAFHSGASGVESAEPLRVAPPVQVDGEIRHVLDSDYQAGPTKLRLLVPDTLPQSPAIVYMLPVEAGEQNRYGDPILEAKQNALHNRYGVVIASLTFSALPWYADHPKLANQQQEKYLLEVVRWTRAEYSPKSPPRGQLLVGFSKSGWGAWTLLLRNPDVFGRAVAWDAPMMMEARGKYGSGPIFGDEDTFAKYKVADLVAKIGTAESEDKGTNKLPARISPLLDDRPRLILLGYGNFHDQHQAIHDRMKSLKAPHRYVDGPFRKHTWHSGWVVEAFKELMPPQAH